MQETTLALLSRLVHPTRPASIGPGLRARPRWFFISFLAAALLLACGGSGPGSVAVARSGHTATLLPSGKVLLVGGINKDRTSSLGSAEIYDPATGSFTVTGSLFEARYDHVATLLPNGKVLVAGGYSFNGFTGAGRTLASAELFDPATGAFTPTGSTYMPRELPAAVVLPNGKVLLTGGAWEGSWEDSAASASAELYDPARGIFTGTGTMTVGRLHPTATLLQDGRVLLTSGADPTPSEVYDPATGFFSATGSYAIARAGLSSTLLPDGQVLLAGGWQTTGSEDIGLPAELYDPATGSFAITGSMLNGRSGHTATLLPSGKVLLAGGVDSKGNPLAGGELYDPATGTFTAIPLASKRSGHTATLLPNGKVLLSNGSASSELIP